MTEPTPASADPDDSMQGAVLICLTALVAGAVIGVVAQWGDLIESKLKRFADVKDASSIIPGHGGLLDRLDSILLALPAAYFLLITVFVP